MTTSTHSNQNTARIIWLLALVLFAQALFPLQLHTAAVKASDGRVVVLCTLQGYKSVQVGADGQIVEVDKSQIGNPHHSAAWSFSQLMTGAVPFYFATPDFSHALNASSLPDYYYAYTPSSYQQSRSIRAPPVLI
jgi:hypothetical protein